MKYLKGSLIVLVSFSLGIGVSPFLLKKRAQRLHAAVKTQKARSTHFVKRISVIGQIAQDPESFSYVTGPARGIVDKCNVKIGMAVKKDETVCVIKTGDSFTEVKSPISGIVISDSLKTGDKIDAVSSPHTIADLSKLWATFDLYEKDLAEVKLGQKVAVRSIAWPGKTFAGEITFISPRIDQDSNTIKVRALIQNPDYLLKLGMFVTADILIESPGQYIMLPLEAVHSMDGKKIVFIKTAKETFRPREVIVKDQTKDQAAVSSGIHEGEDVVVGNGFLLKSELLKSKMGEGCAE
ncbi:MAG: efflux RND transporter periplasmic adaptor subunit [Candidatus Omnitrophica bacterium]|nr:efflux RND transporter periplasmic adaptor subunit [Candidatus Omnitrophota bacterium]